MREFLLLFKIPSCKLLRLIRGDFLFVRYHEQAVMNYVLIQKIGGERIEDKVAVVVFAPHGKAGRGAVGKNRFAILYTARNVFDNTVFRMH